MKANIFFGESTNFQQNAPSAIIQKILVMLKNHKLIDMIYVMESGIVLLKVEITKLS